MKNLCFIFILLFISDNLLAQCGGVNPDCNILNDFECQTNYVGLAIVANPTPGGINTSDNVGQHDDLSDPYDAIIVDYFGPIDLTVFNILKVKVYTNVAGSGGIIAKLEGGTSPPIELSDGITVGSWTEYTFDFSSEAAANHERLVLILNAGSATGGTYYLDDIRWTDDGTATDPCAGTVPIPSILNDFECQQNEPFESCFPIVLNPLPAGINTSVKVGRYTDTDGAYDNLIIDFNASIDLSTYHFLYVQVNTSVAGPLLAKLEGGTSPAKEVTVSAAGTGVWEEFIFDFSSESGADHTKLVLFFNAGSTSGSGDVYFLDNIRFELVLPVELTQFTARKIEEYVAVNWQTAIEENSAGFTIEHSTSASNWKPIGYVPAAVESYSLKDYTFLHKDPRIGANQYRLRSEDLDGYFAHSNIVSVNMEGETGGLIILSNPFTEELGFRINQPYRENAVFKIFDIGGKTVTEGTIELLKGEVNYSLSIPGNVYSGTYFLQLITKRQIFNSIAIKN